MSSEDSRGFKISQDVLGEFNIISVRGYCADVYRFILIKLQVFIFIMTVKIIFCISYFVKLCNIVGDNSCEEELVYIFYHLKFTNKIYKKVHTCSKITYLLCLKRLFISCQMGSINICVL